MRQRNGRIPIFEIRIPFRAWREWRRRVRVGAMPIFYECDRCTACCRWPGQVRLEEGEITRMAAHVGLPEFEFIQIYTRLAEDRRGLALADKENGECIFLRGADCQVNPVKPQQCRNFPNLWNFPGFQEVCRAKAKVLSEEAYRAAIYAATGVGAPD
jgi:Fe-S-cluster containining protein